MICGWGKRVDEFGDDFIEMFGVVDEHGVAGLEDFRAGAGEFGLDEFGLGFELRFIDIEDRFVELGEDGSDIAETEDIEHFDRGSVGGSFQRGFLDVLDVFVGLFGGVHAADKGIGKFGAVDLKSIEHAGEALLHLGSAEVQEAVDQDYSTKFGGACLVDIGEDIGHAVGPAEEDDAGQVQVLEEFVDVAGVACRVIPFRSFLGVSLGARVEGDDAEVAGEVVNLGLEDFRGHGPSGDEDDGRGLV